MREEKMLKATKANCLNLCSTLIKAKREIFFSAFNMKDSSWTTYNVAQRRDENGNKNKNTMPARLILTSRAQWLISAIHDDYENCFFIDTPLITNKWTLGW
jgi:hypothetical protein